MFRAVTLPLQSLQAQGTVKLKVLAAPVNPSDINTVQGVYPVKLIDFESDSGEKVNVPGHEGLFEVLEAPPKSGFKKGDWAISRQTAIGRKSVASKFYYFILLRLLVLLCSVITNLKYQGHGEH